MPAVILGFDRKNIGAEDISGSKVVYVRQGQCALYGLYVALSCSRVDSRGSETSQDVRFEL